MELIIFISMILVFALAVFVLKMPLGLSMAISAVVGIVISGEISTMLRHLIEGTFAYVDTVLVIATAMIFMKVLQESGALDALSVLIIERFYKFPAFLLCLIMLIIMFPAMITGSSNAAVLSAGSIMAPILLLLGVPKVKTAAIISMGVTLGMVAPPVNILAMIIGGGIDLPYVGFTLPLLLLTIPPALLTALCFGYKHVKNISLEEIKPKLKTEPREKFGFRLYIPIILLIVLMMLNKVFPQTPFLGMPLIFMICTVVGLFTGYKVNVLKSGKEAIDAVVSVMAIFMGVGMFIQVMTLTGVRGLIVNTCLSMPPALLYVALAVSIPLFGSISAYGSASVLGVPFALAFLSKDPVIAVAAISMIAGMGDLTPPTALAGVFAAEVSGVESFNPVLKKLIIPIILCILWAVAILAISPYLAKII